MREHQVSKMKMIEGSLEKKDRYKYRIGREKKKVSMNLHCLDKKKGETITKNNVTSYLLKIKID